MNTSTHLRRVRGSGEVSIRVADRNAMHKFYEKVVGLEMPRRDKDSVFFKVAEGHGGPTVGDFVSCDCVHLCI